MSFLKIIFLPVYDLLDRFFKFGNVLKKGDTAIQIGIDMDRTTTSDLFHMARIVGKTGTIIGIEPSPYNIEKIKNVKYPCSCNLILVQKATYSSKGKMTMQMGTKAGWNRLDNIPGLRAKEKFTTTRIEVEMDTVDEILKEINIPPENISHINITNNGAEYYTLQGMKNVIESSENLSIYAIAGRPGELGKVNGENDFTAITNLLKDFGIKYKFQRFSEKFWSGLIKTNLIFGLMKGRFNFGEKTPGVIMAKKGSKTFSIFESYN
jgi:FkbM family methyltransferase